MKILDRKLKKKRTLVFVDLEGTGFSHEMIEIGAYLATINEDGTIKKVGAPFKRYVLAHHPIGHFVENMKHCVVSNLVAQLHCGRTFACQVVEDNLRTYYIYVPIA